MSLTPLRYADVSLPFATGSTIVSSQRLLSDSQLSALAMLGWGPGKACTCENANHCSCSLNPFSAVGVTALPRIAFSSGLTIAAAAAAERGYLPNYSADAAALYSTYSHRHAAYFSYDQPAVAASKLYHAGYPVMDTNGALRKNSSRETAGMLKAWLLVHRKNPYPTKEEKIRLAAITRMTLTQISTWFANVRRRLKKEQKMTWSPRNRSGESLTSFGVADYGSPDGNADCYKQESGHTEGLKNFQEGACCTEAATENIRRKPIEDLAGNDVGDAANVFGKSEDATRQTSTRLKADSGSPSPVVRTKTEGKGAHVSAADKPKIWSLADVSTSSCGAEKEDWASLNSQQPKPHRCSPAPAPSAGFRAIDADNSITHSTGSIQRHADRESIRLLAASLHASQFCNASLEQGSVQSRSST